MSLVDNPASNPSPEPVQFSQWTNPWIGAVGFLVLLIFTWLPNSYGLMVSWPYICVWQGAFLLLGIYTFRLCRQFSIPFERLGYGLDSIVVATIVVSALSTINAQFRAVACWNFLLIINYIICLYFLTNGLRHSQLTRYFLWMLLAVTGVITSIISLSFWRPRLDMWLSTNFDSAIRNAQPLGHHNFVGGYELLVLPIVLTFAFAQTGWRKWAGSIAAGVVAFALYASGSRGALVGALALGLISVGLGLVLSKKNNRNRWIAASCCLMLIMSVALVSNPRVKTLFAVNSAVEESAVSVISISDGPTKDRIFMIEAARNILKDHPMLGVGPGNLSRVYNTYRPIETGAGLTLVQQLHNTPAQLAAELGIAGLIVYFVLLATLLRLGIFLYRTITEQCDRLLLYGIGASWFGYGVSSLSDYQLENVGITITLIATTALLINLGDAYHPAPKNLSLSTRTRRISSLCILVLLCCNFQLWTRVDTGLYLADSAIKKGEELALVAADEKFAKASQLVPWDPTYSALASEAILDVAAGIHSQDDRQELETLATDYLKKAVMAAPNDPWFNQNLATLLLKQDPKEAEKYAKQAARLAPRSYVTYTYYTLGSAYLQQNKTEEAINAFVLESLINPIFLTATLWNQTPFSTIKEIVLKKTLDGFQEILSTTNKQSAQYQWLHEQWTILSWWYDRPITEQDCLETRDLVQVILLADEDAERSLALLNNHIVSNHLEESEYSSDLHLIQARLAPDKYLPSLLLELDGTDEEKTTLETTVRSDQSMKSWFKEVSDTAQTAVRYGAYFAYRNLASNAVHQILNPGNLEVGILPSSIIFFAEAPREYLQLDQHLAKIRSEKLKI